MRHSAAEDKPETAVSGLKKALSGAGRDTGNLDKVDNMDGME